MFDPAGHQATQFIQRLVLDLAHPLLADTKVAAEFRQRHGFIAQPPFADDDALALGERIERLMEPGGAAHTIDMFEHVSSGSGRVSTIKSCHSASPFSPIGALRD